MEVIILKYISVSGQHIVYLELTQCYMPVVSQQSWEEERDIVCLGIPQQIKMNFQGLRLGL